MCAASQIWHDRVTEGLKALAGSALRTVLSTAAAAPLHASFWGIVTLLVQTTSATAMTPSVSSVAPTRCRPFIG
jgi:Na+/phosphate symporter